MKKYIFILLSISSISLFSCGDFQDVSFNGIENVRIISLTQHGAEAEITAKIKNPNNVSFTIYPVDLDVVLGGMNAGKAHISGRTKIKAHSEKSYTFRIKSDFSNISMNDLPKLMSLAMSKNVKVGLKGKLKAGKLFIKKSFPVDVQESVPMSTN